MKRIKKILFTIILSVFSLLSLSSCNEEILKKEVNGLVFESEHVWDVYTTLTQISDTDYNLMIVGSLSLSVTNTKDSPFTFQANAISFTVGNDYPFNFLSIENTATGFYTQDAQDYVTIEGNSQTVFHIRYKYLNNSLRAYSINELKSEIKSRYEDYKIWIKEKNQSLRVKYLTTTIIESTIYPKYHTPQQLIDWL